MFYRALRQCRGQHSRSFASSVSVHSNGPNHHLTTSLADLGKQETEPYKIRAFKAAIRAIETVETPITSATEARKLPGIGERIGGRIDAILKGIPYVAPNLQLKAAKLQAAKALNRVSGISEVAAAQFAHEGCTCVEDLLKPEFFDRLRTVSKQQVIHHAHLSKEPSKEEAETILGFVRDNLDAKFQCMLVGQFRRPFAGQEIDKIRLLLSHPDHVFVPTPTITAAQAFSPKRTTKRPDPFPKLVGEKPSVTKSGDLTTKVITPMKERGLIVDTFVTHYYKWSGLVAVPVKNPDGQWASRGSRIVAIKRNECDCRWLEIYYSPSKSLGAAMLSSTGDAAFVRHLVAQARKHGFLLDDFGLWRWNEPGGSGGFWEKVMAETEEEIFAEIQMDFVPVEKRNFASLTRKRRTF